MLKPRVAVLRGGPSSEYEVSLKTGQAVLAHLPGNKYHVRDVFIDKQGTWHLRGLPIEPARALDQFDVVFNALHGTYGEDGTLQRVLDTHRVRYTGSGTLASALGMQKHLAKAQLTGAPCKLPLHRVLVRERTTTADIATLFRTFTIPAVVKPVNGGSSVATKVAISLQSLIDAVEQAFMVSDTVLVEQYIKGREVTVGIIDDFRGERLYALPAIEIVPTKSGFFDYDEKYAGHARELCPAPLSYELKQELYRAARAVHTTLGLRDYSRSDFIIGRDGIYFLEVNTLPGLTEASLIPKAVQAVGSSLPEFLDHVITRALERK